MVAGKTESLQLGGGMSLFLTPAPAEGQVLIAIYGEWSHQGAILSPKDTLALIGMLQAMVKPAEVLPPWGPTPYS